MITCSKKTEQKKILLLIESSNPKKKKIVNKQAWSDIGKRSWNAASHAPLRTSREDAQTLEPGRSYDSSDSFEDLSFIEHMEQKNLLNKLNCKNIYFLIFISLFFHRESNRKKNRRRRSSEARSAVLSAKREAAACHK